jgi:hypothetical protein
MIDIGEKGTVITLAKREGACEKGGVGNSETMRTGSTSKYRPGCGSRTHLELWLLLHRYGVMRHEFE